MQDWKESIDWKKPTSREDIVEIHLMLKKMGVFADDVSIDLSSNGRESKDGQK